MPQHTNYLLSQCSSCSAWLEFGISGLLGDFQHVKNSQLLSSADETVDETLDKYICSHQHVPTDEETFSPAGKKGHFSEVSWSVHNRSELVSCM